jgi:hypothetical protein
MVLVAVLLLPIGAVAQEVSKQRMSQGTSSPSNYPLKLHVTRSFITEDGHLGYLHLVGVLDGMNVELLGSHTGADFFDTAIVRPGDYPAALIGQRDNKDGSFVRQYSVSLGNGQQQAFTLIGLSQ